MYGRYPGSPLPDSSITGMSPIPSAAQGASPRAGAATPFSRPQTNAQHISSASSQRYTKNPLEVLPATAPPQSAPLSYILDSDIAVGSSMTHTDTIIPFNIGIAEKLLAAAERQMQGADKVPPVSAITFTMDQLVTLQQESTEYVEGLSGTLRGLFAEDNSKVRKRLATLADTPLTFQYFRLQQQVMQLSGDYSLQKDKEMLTRLAALLE